MNQAVENLLRRDRAVVLICLAVVVALAWAYLLAQAAGTDMMSRMMSFARWTPADALLTFTMWVVMMIAMMIPSAAPLILLYVQVFRKRMPEQLPYMPVSSFLLGYLAVWAGASGVATALQWTLEQLALLSPMLVSISAPLSGALLIAAGIYQWTPAKRVCLGYCRSPVEFLSRNWKHGARGAFQMGVKHGVYCFGCCWAVMLLLFVGGIMNLLWVALIAGFVLIEKNFPRGQVVGRVGAAAMMIAGVILLVQ